MSKKSVILVIGVLTAFVLLLGFVSFASNSENESNSDEGNDKIQATVSILPQEYFVERVGGDEVEVAALIPPGSSPATYEPKPSQLADLERSEIYFRIGHIPFEKNHIDRISESNSSMKIVDTSEGIDLREIEEHSHEGEEDHQENHQHEEGGDDPHIWLDPNLVQTQVESIYDGLVEIRPEKEEYFRQNKEEFLQDLQDLDNDLTQTFEPFQGETMLVYHPAFGYLADRYGFEQEHFEIEGKEPSPEEIQQVIDEAKEEKISVVFVQKQFSTSSAETIAREIDGSVVSINPLEKDYLTNMREISKQITQSTKE